MLRLVLNLIWLVLSGFWLAIGYALAGIVMFVLIITIIGIPLGWANIKLAAVAIAPLGKEVVPSGDPRAVNGLFSPLAS